MIFLRCIFLAIKEPARHLKRRVFLSTVNSILAGMVAVAGGAVAYNPWSAVVVGFIAALSFLLWSKFLIKLHIDDPVETAAGKQERKRDFSFCITSLSFLQFTLVVVYGVSLLYQSFDEQLDPLWKATLPKMYSTQLYIALPLEKAGE